MCVHRTHISTPMYSYSIHMYTYLYICTTSLRLKKEKFVPWSQRSIAEENVTSTEGFYILPSTKIKFVHGHRILGSLAKPVSGAGNSLIHMRPDKKHLWPSNLIGTVLDDYLVDFYKRGCFPYLHFNAVR